MARDSRGDRRSERGGASPALRVCSEHPGSVLGTLVPGSGVCSVTSGSGTQGLSCFSGKTCTVRRVSPVTSWLFTGDPGVDIVRVLTLSVFRLNLRKMRPACPAQGGAVLWRLSPPRRASSGRGAPCRGQPGLELRVVVEGTLDTYRWVCKPLPSLQGWGRRTQTSQSPRRLFEALNICQPVSEISLICGALVICLISGSHLWQVGGRGHTCQAIRSQSDT